jgi:hypothetical protein
VSHSGRAGTGNAVYRRNRSILLATAPDVCAICGHGGTMTADHIISDPLWPRGADGRRLPGFDELGNLQRAHGTMGPVQPANRCPTCRRLCNQSKGDGRRRRYVRPQSRRWL